MQEIFLVSLCFALKAPVELLSLFLINFFLGYLELLGYVKLLSYKLSEATEIIYWDRNAGEFHIAIFSVVTALLGAPTINGI